MPQIKELVKSYDEKNLELAPGYSFNQKDVLNRIELYLNSKFESSEFDDDGFKKFFYNIITKVVETSAKMIDIDTKDFRFIAEGTTPYIKVWLMEREFKRFIRDQRLGVLLNEITDGVPAYGSHVIRKFQDNWVSVPIRNIKADSSVSSLKESPTIVFEHVFNSGTIQLQKGWINIDKSIEKAEDPDNIIVYEKYEMDGDGWIYTIEDENDVVLFAPVKVSKLNLREFHWKKFHGRWLAVGEIEKNFDPQEKMNEIENLKGKGLHWSSLNIFQTKDETISRNLLTNVQNGQILRTIAPIERIPIEERNSTAYAQAEQRWDKLIADNSFVRDVLLGAKSPAGTTLGEVQINTLMASGYFEKRQENIVLSLKEWMFEDIIPDFKNKKSKSHLVDITSPEDIELYDKLIHNGEVNKEVLKFLDKNKYLPSIQQLEILKGIIKSKGSSVPARTHPVPDNFYNDAKYRFDLVISGESIDLGAKLNILNTVLVMVAQNPGIFKDPQTKKIIFRMLDYAGINPEEIATQEPEGSIEDVMASRGGSLPTMQPASPSLLPSAV